MSSAYTSILLTSANPTVKSNANWFFTVQLKNGGLNAPLVETIDVSFTPATGPNILGTVHTDSTGKFQGSLPVASMGTGTFTMRAVGRSTGIFSNSYSITVTGTTATTYDRITIAILPVSLTALVTETFVITAQLKLGTANALIAGVGIQLGIDGSSQGLKVTEGWGGVKFNVPASTLTVGTHTAVVYVDSNPGIASPTRSISVSGGSTVGQVNLVITNPSLTDSATPFQFTGDVKDTAGLPMAGVTVALGSKSGLSSVFLFNTTWATTNSTGQFGGTQMTGDGTYDFKAVANSIESGIVSGTRTLPPAGDPLLTITRNSDGSAVTDVNNQVVIDSVINVAVTNFTPNTTTAVKIWYIPVSGGQWDEGNINTNASGSGSTGILMGASSHVGLGLATIGVVDQVNPANNMSININVVEAGGPPPPPPGGGIGKVWSEMTFTEKVFAVGVGAFALPVVLKLAGVDRVTGSLNRVYPPKVKKYSKGINYKELRKFMRRKLL